MPVVLEYACELFPSLGVFFIISRLDSSQKNFLGVITKAYVSSEYIFKDGARERSSGRAS